MSLSVPGTAEQQSQYVVATAGCLFEGFVASSIRCLLVVVSDLPRAMRAPSFAHWLTWQWKKLTSAWDIIANRAQY